jgi:uncharacterized glyoxalase superfamily protein PhnB
MTITALKPFIPSGKDFALARRFFVDLGFAVRWEGGGYAELALGAAAFILQDFHHADMQANLMMFAKVDDLDAWWTHLVASGVADRYPGVRIKAPTDYPWGQREVHVIDPAGVCWHFA